MLKILIISSFRNNLLFSDNKKNYKIDVKNLTINEINEMNPENYNYIITLNSNKNDVRIEHYIPLKYFENDRYKVFISELGINNVILDILELTTVSKRQTCSLAIILKNIIRYDITQEKFNLIDLLHIIKKRNQYDDEIMKLIKKDIYNVVRRDYTYKKTINKVKYYFYRKKLVQKYIYINLNSILSDLKVVTNELNKVFKNKEVYNIINNYQEWNAMYY